MARAKNYLIAALSFHIIWLLFLSKPGSALKPKIPRSFPAILIFGDSTVDTGNNNFISTIFKANYFPYGKNFPGHVSTGRFSDGKLIPDMVASRLGIKEFVPPFLDPKLSNDDVKTGVSFASAGTGFDDLTAIISRVIPVMKQINLFKNYAERLQKIVGASQSRRILKNAFVVISAGTNDFNVNFYDIPTRKLQYNISGYQDFIQSRLQTLIKKIYRLGCRNMVVAGLPPIGCLPIQQTMSIRNPDKGCCGSGLNEAGPLCNSITPTCKNPSKFMFWDSIHPTEAAYKIIADSLLKKLDDLLYRN